MELGVSDGCYSISVLNPCEPDTPLMGHLPGNLSQPAISESKAVYGTQPTEGTAHS